MNKKLEPNVLTPKRTEYGKAVRKQYDSGQLDESRHNMTQLEPRTDGVCNTLTATTKDNLLAEPHIKGISVHPNSHKLEFKGDESIKEDVSPTLRATDYKCPHVVWEEGIEYKGKHLKDGDGLYLHNSERFDHGSLENISRTLKADKHDAGVVENYRIRKLTPRECFRLQGVSDKNIDIIQSAGISKTQQYKMAGNSITVDVLFHIFRKLFVEKGCENQQLTLF